MPSERSEVFFEFTFLSFRREEINPNQMLSTNTNVSTVISAKQLGDPMTAKMETPFVLVSEARIRMLISSLKRKKNEQQEEEEDPNTREVIRTKRHAVSKNHVDDLQLKHNQNNFHLIYLKRIKRRGKRNKQKKKKRHSSRFPFLLRRIFEGKKRTTMSPNNKNNYPRPSGGYA